MNHPARRRSSLAKTLKKDGVEAVLITNPLNVTYLTGFTGDSSFAIIAPKQTVIVSDSRFEIQIAEECADIDAEIRTHKRNTWQAASARLTKMGFRKVGVESSHLTLADLERLKTLAPTIDFAPLGGRTEELRAIKDADEIATIRRAIQQGEKAFEMLRLMARPTDSEIDLVHAMESYLHRAGADERSFPVIIGIGNRSALPHAPPQSNIRLSDDIFYLVDWGAKTGGYHGDTTRVLRSPGAEDNFPKSQRVKVETRLAKLYTTVLEAQKAARDAVRPGVSVQVVDAAARKVVDDAGMGERFNHGLGHGVGLQIHEAPSIRGNSEDVLQAGMVITLEPGVYEPGCGGVRIEVTFVITQDGCERINTLPQEWEAYFG